LTTGGEPDVTSVPEVFSAAAHDVKNATLMHTAETIDAFQRPLPTILKIMMVSHIPARRRQVRRDKRIDPKGASPTSTVFVCNNLHRTASSMLIQ
jgi:hypothetical protein